MLGSIPDRFALATGEPPRLATMEEARCGEAS